MILIMMLSLNNSATLKDRRYLGTITTDGKNGGRVTHNAIKNHDSARHVPVEGAMPRK